MKRFPSPAASAFLVALLALTLVPAGSVAAQEVSGTWSSHRNDGGRDADRLQLNMRIRHDDGEWNSGFSLRLAQLQGLASEVAFGRGDDVTFRLVRDAGTVTFEGDFRDGEGTGFFSFVADQGYVRAMADLGYSELSASRLYQFAVQDVSLAYVRGLQDLGYASLSLKELTRFAIHGVRLEFIRGMNDLGYAEIAPQDLVRMRIHGVSVEFVREMRAALR